MKNILLHDFQSRLRPLHTDFLSTTDISLFEQNLIKEKGKQATPCAVVAICFEEDQQLKTTFILRPTYEGTHSGQIAFAGGKKDSNDTSLIQTALRECYEELGLELQKENLLGALPDVYIPPSHSLVTPFVAYLPEKPIYKPDTREVAKVLELNLADFKNPANQQIQEIVISSGKTLKLPCFVVEGYTIWGATARMVQNFLTLMQ
jgi:8-oxo-dGTP pyrophosphatase MutT (NUDIX family)